MLEAKICQRKSGKIYFITTAAASVWTIQRIIDALKGFTDCLPGAVVKGKIFGGRVYQKG